MKQLQKLLVGPTYQLAKLCTKNIFCTKLGFKSRLKSRRCTRSQINGCLGSVVCLNSCENVADFFNIWKKSWLKVIAKVAWRFVACENAKNNILAQ